MYTPTQGADSSLEKNEQKAWNRELLKTWKHTQNKWGQLRKWYTTIASTVAKSREHYDQMGDSDMSWKKLPLNQMKFGIGERLETRPET